MAARYPVVLFDVGQTLIGPRDSFGATYARVLGEQGLELEAGALEYAIQGVSAGMARTIPVGTDRFSHFPGGETEFWMRFLSIVLQKVAGRSFEPGFVACLLDRLREAFVGASAWQVFDDVRPVLRDLEADGVRMGVVSNWDSRLPAVLETLGLSRYFETIGVSHLEQVEKPDPDLFRRVLARLHTEPRQALHVGDDPELDREGARAAGADCLLVDRRGRLDGMPGVVSDLRSLPQLSRRGFSRT